MKVKVAQNSNKKEKTCMSSVPKMMTIRQVAATGVLPEYALRNGVKQGWVPHIKSGNKYFINYDKLLDILNNL